MGSRNLARGSPLREEPLKKARDPRRVRGLGSIL